MTVVYPCVWYLPTAQPWSCGRMCTVTVFLILESWKNVSAYWGCNPFCIRENSKTSLALFYFSLVRIARQLRVISFSHMVWDIFSDRTSVFSKAKGQCSWGVILCSVFVLQGVDFKIRFNLFSIESANVGTVGTWRLSIMKLIAKWPLCPRLKSSASYFTSQLCRSSPTKLYARASNKANISCL